MVASADAVLDTQAVGYADIAAKKLMTADAMFWIASTTKPMTATAFMMLVDEGRASTGDPVETYLPEFKNMWHAAEKTDQQIVLKKASRPITLHDLLTHTSGLQFLSKSEPVIDARPLREVVVSAASAPLQADTGTAYIYSNAGSNTVGRVIEIISGLPYETFMQKRLFDPLGMIDTTFFPSPPQLARLARTYKSNEAKDGLIEWSLNQFLNPFASTPRYPAPGGGLFSTASDVIKFAQMILRGGEAGGWQLVSRNSVRRMTGVQSTLPRDGTPNTTGYHFAASAPVIEDGPCPAGTCGHGGAYSNDMSINPETGLVTAWMVQHAGWPTIEGEQPLQAFKRVAAETYWMASLRDASGL